MHPGDAAISTRSRFHAFACVIAMLLAVIVTQSGPVFARSLTRVSFPSIDRDETGAPVQIQAIMLLPDGPAPSGGYPAVIALHGCSGMYSIAKGREDHLADRLAVRVDMLLGDGYAVLVPDSFRSRGRNEVCTIKIGDNPITPTRRRLDALGALAYLADRSDVAHDRIALVGWSHGGSTALATVNIRDREVETSRENIGATASCRAAVAF